MSFAKAKIHRFNDDIPCVPSPGKYNPAIIDKSVGPAINKSERFTEGKGIFLTGSCELSNVSKDSENCKTPFTQFKTPKVPASASKFEMKRNSNFGNRKASSTEFICKKNQSSIFEINSLKLSLNEVQEELALERNKTNNLIREMQQLKEICEQSDEYSEALIDMLNEKTNLISVLEEKCSTLENITAESFDCYYKHVTSVYDIFEVYFENSEKSESDFSQIFQKYEDLISNYESYFQDMVRFLSQLLRDNDNYANFLPSTSQEVEIIGRLKELEKERRKYELVVQEMQKVIGVLRDRVLESDQEVEKLSSELTSSAETNKKLVDITQEKDEEISTLRSLVNEIAMNFLNEVKTTENDLLNLVNILKEKALNEKKTCEKQLVERNTLISKLRLEKSQKDLELQESLDLIEMLKCKEETSEKVIQQLRNECCELRGLLDCQKLNNERTFYDENYLNELNVTFTKEFEPRELDNPGEEHVFINHLFDLTTKQMNNCDSRTNNLHEIDLFSQNVPISVESVKCQMEKVDFKVEWLHSLLSVVYDAMRKSHSENLSMKSNYDRLRNDFVEKCDECAELTQLLQVAEKRTENFEKQISDSKESTKLLENVISEQKSKIEKLTNENELLKENSNELIFENKNNEIIIKSLNEELTKLREKLDNNVNDDERMTELENSLKQTQSKLRTSEKENSRLSKLIGPYRQTLEKYESITKLLCSKSENDVVKKFSKLLDQQNTKLNMKQFTKLRNDNVQLRKKVEELQTENNKYRKVTVKCGKENKPAKNDYTEKIARVEMPVNSTYVITSPKVNRI